MSEFMPRLRPLEEQFTRLTLLQIRQLQMDLDAIPFRDGAGRFYSKELIFALEAGLLLSSLHLTSSLLELFVRDLLIYSATKKANERNVHVLDELEIYYEDSNYPHKWSFAKIVDELQGQNIISNLDADNVKTYYQAIRIPLHHGLTRRFLRGKKSSMVKSDSFDLDEVLFLGRILRGHSLEEQLERRGIALIKKVVVFMEKYSNNLMI